MASFKKRSQVPTDTQNGTFPMTPLSDSPNTAPPTSSPPLQSSPMVYTKERVARTYGSKQMEAPPSDESPDADRSFGTLVDGDISTLLSPAPRSRGIDDNVVSSQDTKVDDDDDDDKDGSTKQPKHQWSWKAALEELSESDDEKGSSTKQPKHQWSWKAALKELSESDGEDEFTPALPVPRRSADVDASSSPPASRGRGAKSKGKRPSTSPRKPQRLPLTTTHSPRLSARVPPEPEASGSDGEHSPSPLSPKQKLRTSGRMVNAHIVGDSESEAPHASSSKSRGSRFDSGDVDANDRRSPDPAKRKRKATTSRKPTAKVKCHDVRSAGSY